MSESGKGFLINAGPLSHALKTLKPFVSKEQTRYYLCGIFLDLPASEDEINFVATDGHKLGRLIQPVDRETGFEEAIAAIIPTKAVETLSVMLKGLNEDFPIAISFSENGHRMFVDAGDEKGDFKLVDGTYPDYRSVIPSDKPDFIVGLAKAQAKEAMAAIAAQDKKKPLVWELKDHTSPLLLHTEESDEQYVIMPMRITLPGEPEGVQAEADQEQYDLEDHLEDAA